MDAACHSGQFDKAATIAQSIIAAPTNASSSSLLSLSYTIIGVRSLRSRDYGVANDAFTRALSHDSSFEDALYYRAVLAMESPVAVDGANGNGCTVALSSLNQIRWERWRNGTLLSRYAWRWRNILNSLLLLARIQEDSGLYREAAISYSHAWALAGDTQLPNDCESLLLDGVSALPRALAMAQSALDCGRCIRDVAVTPPAHVSSRLLPSLRRRLGSLLLRATSTNPPDYITAAIGGTRPTSTPSTTRGVEEATLLLLLASLPPSSIPGKGGKESKVGESVVAYCRCRDYDAAVTACKQSLVTSLDDHASWYRLALACVGAKRYSEAYLAIAQCVRRQPDFVPALLTGAQLCLQHLSRAREAVRYSKRAIRVLTGQSRTPAISPQAAAHRPTISTTHHHNNNGDGHGIPTSPSNATISSSSSMSSIIAPNNAPVPMMVTVTPATGVTATAASSPSGLPLSPSAPNLLNGAPSTPLSSSIAPSDSSSSLAAPRALPPSTSLPNLPRVITGTIGTPAMPTIGTNATIVVPSSVPPSAPSPSSVSLSVSEVKVGVDRSISPSPTPAPAEHSNNGNGINMSKPVVGGAGSAAQLLTARTLFALSASRYAYQVSLSATRQSLQQSAVEAARAAHQATPDNARASYILACVLADIRDIDTSLSLVKQSLAAARTHIPSWILLALLLSANKQPEFAIATCDAGLAELAPSGVISLELLLIKARLLLSQNDYDSAIGVFTILCNHMFDDTLYRAATVVGAPRRPYVIPAVLPDPPVERKRRSTVTAPSPTLPTPTSEWYLSLHCQTLIAMAECYGAMVKVNGNADTSLLLDDAISCLQRAAQLISTSTNDDAIVLLPTIHSSLASLSVPPSLWSSSSSTAASLTTDVSLSSCLTHYQNALVINPSHVPSLLGLAAIELQRRGGSESVVYGHLTAALHADDTCHHAWHELGMIHRRGNRHELAAAHLLNELELERTAPAISFCYVPRL